MTMGNRINDLKKLVRQELVGNAGIIAVIADRVYNSSPRRSDDPGIVFPCVVITLMSGGSMYAGVIQDVRLQVQVWSQESSSQAQDVYAAAFAALNTAHLYDAKTKTGGALVNPMHAYAREVSRPVDGWDESIGAWYAEGVFVVVSKG